MNVVTPLHGRVSVLGAIVCLGLLVPNAGHAGLLLIGNVATTPGGGFTEPIGNSGFGADEESQGAVKFILPAGADYTLDNVILRLQSTQSSDPTPVISLHSDDAGGNAPGSSLGTLTNPAFPDDLVHDFTFTPIGAVTLSNNTAYWLLVDGGETLSYSWNHGGVLPSQPVAALDSYYFSCNNGGSYFASDEVRFVFAINGSTTLVVPEPSTALLMLFSTVGLVPFWWRRQRATY